MKIYPVLDKNMEINEVACDLLVDKTFDSSEDIKTFKNIHQTHVVQTGTDNGKTNCKVPMFLMDYYDKTNGRYRKYSYFNNPDLANRHLKYTKLIKKEEELIEQLEFISKYKKKYLTGGNI